MQGKYWAGILMSGLMLSAGAVEPWRDPTVSSINRMKARSPAVPCESAAVALAIAKGEKPDSASLYVMQLDGMWDFKWKHTIDHPQWEQTTKLMVPGCWQLQGKFDPPLYTNVAYPLAGWNVGDPMVEPPAHFTAHYYRNPVGQYSRSFVIPDAWKGRRVIIRFEGVSSAMYVKLNGKEIGYAEDSRLPSEFDLTEHLKTGENALEVMVIKHSDGTFLEDQDFWRLSGIFRSVKLISERQNASMNAIAYPELSDDLKRGKVRIVDENGKILLTKDYGEVRLWDAGEPNVYYEAVNCGGDWRGIAFGFRKIEIRDAVVYVNGKRILIKGVNRHEMEPETGYTVTEQGMKRDLEIMRDLNINAVRTCHYPDDLRWYGLCDRAGIYVCCEANVETHGAAGRLPSLPAYHDAIVERETRMVEFLRNHPSIIFWSLGNECGYAKVFEDGYKAVKTLDDTRPVQYEPAQDCDCSDIKCPMYARPWDCERYVANEPKKPLILCEYVHAMGNSTGDMAAYWKLAEKYPSFQGGFIWDFADQALWKMDEQGKMLAYGGDFGDKPNDDNFNCNGIVAADRTYHPGAYEVKAIYGGKLTAERLPEKIDDSSFMPKSPRSPQKLEFKLNCYRAPTDNDRGWRMDKVSSIWKEATETGKLPEGVTGGITTEDTGKGIKVALKLKVPKGLPPIPRVGVSFKLPADFTHIRWAGRGPHENYCDRNLSAPFGVYEMPLSQFNPVNYSEPGECGYRTDTSLLSLSDGKGTIVIKTLDKPFGFNVWPYSQSLLEKARHQRDLVSEGAVFVNIDAAQMGVGGDNSWGARAHNEHLLREGEYSLEFLICQ